MLFAISVMPQECFSPWWRMNSYGLLDESQNKLDYVWLKTGMAKSIHHARVLIKQRHIRVRRQVVKRNWLSRYITYLLYNGHSWLESTHTNTWTFSLTSPFGGGRPGKVKRKNQKADAKKAAAGDADEDDEKYYKYYIMELLCLLSVNVE